MTSDPDLTDEDIAVELPDEAPEADVLEQHQTPSGLDEREDEPAEVPIEADPADVFEQRRTVGGTDDDDYR
jgi:hypothetical protein